jgi:hypothetical protein
MDNKIFLRTATQGAVSCLTISSKQGNCELCMTEGLYLAVLPYGRAQVAEDVEVTVQSRRMLFIQVKFKWLKYAFSPV